jgi:hypothetical protein
MSIIEVLLVGLWHCLLIDDVPEIMKQCGSDHRTAGSLAFGKHRALKRMLQLGNLFAPIATLAS